MRPSRATAVLLTIFIAVVGCAILATLIISQTTIQNAPPAVAGVGQFVVRRGEEMTYLGVTFDNSGQTRRGDFMYDSFTMRAPSASANFPLVNFQYFDGNQVTAGVFVKSYRNGDILVWQYGYPPDVPLPWER